MAGRRDIRVGGAVVAVTLPLLVLALVVGAGAALWQRGDLNGLICDGDCGPSNIVPPQRLTTATSPGTTGVDAAQSLSPVDPARLSAAVEGALDADVLGPHVGFVAISPDDGTVLFESGLGGSGGGTFVPASTTKVLTGFAALSTIDPGTRFTTRVVRDGDRVVLVGGGDPYLSTKRAGRDDDRVVRADLTTLARRTVAALKKDGVTAVTLDYDASLFTGPDESPAWVSTYVSENIVTPVSALWTDQGVENGVRSRDPAGAAARTFAGLLEKRGITVSGEPAATEAPGDARPVAAVRSATIGQIVETLIRVSDNQAAEVVLRHVAIAADRPASFEGGADAVVAALDEADVDTAGLRLHDGSGLSRSNRISPTTLVQALGVAAASEQVSGLLADLPVSGFTGTLVGRFSRLSTALGTVRAKTGTLSGIHSLAGYAVDAEGRPVLFAVMADRADRDQPFQAQAALDKVAAAVASCRCGR